MKMQFILLTVLLSSLICQVAHGAASMRSEKDIIDNVKGISSSGSRKAAELLIGSMNQTADPCIDFFEYACGRWNAEHPIPDDHASFGILAAIREKVALEIKKLYESNQSIASTALNEVRTIYQSCMNTDRIEEMNGHEIIQAIDNLGTWPVMVGDAWPEKNFDLTELMIKTTQSRSITTFVNIYASPDLENVTQRLIQVDQGSLGLGSGAREYYLKPDQYSVQLKAYKKYIISKILLISHDAGIKQKLAEIEPEVDRIIEFETQFAKITIPDDHRKNWTKMCNTEHLSVLNKLMPQIDWNRYFRRVFPDDLHWYLDDDPVININDIDFLQQLNSLLERTPKRVIANYIIWRYTSAWSFQLGDRYDDIQQDFLRTIVGKQTKSPRWKDCIQAASGRMSYASGALYVRSFFHEEDKQVAMEMTNELKNAFEDMLIESNWMSSSTLNASRSKLEKMITLIGFPDFIIDDKKLDEHYQLLHIKANDTYAKIVEKTSKWAMEKSLRKLVEPTDRTEFGTSSATVNAFYSAGKNAIVFPAAILQAPLFDSSFPKAMNFGGIGSVIGHEITHGFDDQGSQFDENGNLRKWWDEKTAANFEQRAKCFVDEYGAFEVEKTGLHLNGLLTESENIADNGGVKQAFRAYKNYVKKRGYEEERLPGLEHLNMDKIFFLSFAQTWCGSSRSEALIRQVMTDSHSPMRTRVNGVMINNPSFANAFKCPQESLMNPSHKCTLW